MRIKKILAVFSSEPLRVNVPSKWADLSPRQFRLVCSLFAADIPADCFDSILFLRLARLRAIAAASGEDGPVVQSGRRIFMLRHDAGGLACDSVAWVHEVAPLDALRHLVGTVHKSAVDLRLKDLSFGAFVAADSSYAGYVSTGKPELADRIVRTLWPRIRKIRNWHRPAAVIWFSAVKSWLADVYPDLFAEPDREDMFASRGSSPADVRKSVNVQIRALTKGDITAEERVLAAPLHRALTELDALAREYKEFKNSCRS
jgi:hypothetical protein